MSIARRSFAGLVVPMFYTAMVIASPAQTFTSLASFTGTNGANPLSSVVQGTDGNFYGTTQQGGNPDCAGSGCGTVFKITPIGTLSTIYKFCSVIIQNNCADGLFPMAGLVLGTDGNFYGTTSAGGSGGGYGTVFRITPSGSLTTLHSFSNVLDGATPSAPLLLASDGNFYGTTVGGGQGSFGNFQGTIFKITPNGTFTLLYTFCNLSACDDGAQPAAGLVQGTDGNFYGTTEFGNVAGCVQGCGTVFKITPMGTLTTLYIFCSLSSCIDGFLPVGGLVQGTDGNFYGTTSSGGAHTGGTVFKITPNGTLSTLHSFNGFDGGGPSATLVQASDGNFYGTTISNGAGHGGTIFKITPSGSLSTLYNFCPQRPCTDGAGPQAALLQAGNGTLYGTTYSGGTGQDGTVFSLSGPTPTAVQFVPVTPCRLVDTRQTQTPIQGGTWQNFIVPQLGGCNIPATAAAYSLNVTVVPHGPLGYLTVWPTGRNLPNVSTLNSLDRRIKADAVIVPAGADAAISAYATNTTDIILDINGYFALPGAGTYQFYPLTPCRIVDTRNNQDGGTLQRGMERDYAIAGHCGVPSSATAYSLNVTVLPAAGGLDFLIVWPQGETRPNVSTLNDYTGTIVANAAIVPAGSNNTTAFYPNGNNTDLLVDINGYFAPPGSGGLSLYMVVPCRVLDTRNNNGHGFVGTIAVNVVGSPCAPPSSAQSYVFNATVVPPGPMLFLTLWPHGTTQPTVSTLNAQDGAITSNMAVVPTNDGSIDAYAYALTQLILDISGYFAP